MSNIVTSAPRPESIFADCVPTTPPPITTAFAGLTPGIPPRSMPHPFWCFSRNFAPCCAAILPATSDIGVSRGREPSEFSTVS